MLDEYLGKAFKDLPTFAFVLLNGVFASIAFFAVFLISYGAYNMIIEPFDSEFYQNVGHYFLPVLLFLMALGLVKWAVLKVENQEKRSKISMMVGLGGISIWAAADKTINLMDYPQIPEWLPSITFVFTSLIYMTFVLFSIDWKAPGPVKTDRIFVQRGYRILLAFNIIVLIVSMRIACLGESDPKKRERAAEVQIASSFTLTLSMMNFFGIAASFWQFEVQAGPAPDAQHVVEAQNLVELARRAPEAQKIMPECKICTTAYNTTTRTPKMLSNCGHTICQECAGKLMAQNRGTMLFCPYCQTATAVNGPVEKLPKNFALLEAMVNLKL